MSALQELKALLMEAKNNKAEPAQKIVEHIDDPLSIVSDWDTQEEVVEQVEEVKISAIEELKMLLRDAKNHPQKKIVEEKVLNEKEVKALDDLKLFLSQLQTARDKLEEKTEQFDEFDPIPDEIIEEDAELVSKVEGYLNSPDPAQTTTEEAVLDQITEANSPDPAQTTTKEAVLDQITEEDFDLVSKVTGYLSTPKKTRDIEKDRFKDPAVPLDRNFVTFKQLNEHYNLLINRIQQQLSTVGGGGEVKLEFLDDIDRRTAKVDGKFLKYDAATKKWIGADGGGGGSVDEEVVVDLINQNERLVYTTSDQYRIITGYREDDEVLSIRATSIAGPHLRFELASFSPSVSATGQSLAWDQAATGFSVSVDNPTDFTERWINSVSLIDNATGVHTTLGNYTTSGPSATPAGGVDWSQTFSTNATATIRSNGSGLSGGSASARITFKDNDDNDWGTKPTISFNWGGVGHSLSFGSLSGKTFLDYYTSVGYFVSVTGFSSGANYVNTVTGSGGTPSNGSGSGTFTFTTGLHKNNNNTSRQVNLSTNFNRPAAVTGTAYTVTNAISDNTISASFSYPSFYIWTVNTLTAPTRADIVNGYGFESGVTQLGDQTKVVNGFINNSDSNPRAFWFAVRTAASQPSSFQTGPTAALLSDTSVTTGITVNLEPDSPLSGYVAEGYTLYGITLQPGNTYVSIS